MMFQHHISTWLYHHLCKYRRV